MWKADRLGSMDKVRPDGFLNGGKAMNMLSLEQELKGNAYPGRGIVIGRTQDGKDIEAREHIAYGSTVAGVTMQLTSTIAQHSMEHSMSAYHHNLPHGAGLIMISKAFAEFFIERHACDEQFIKMAKAMGIANADKPEDFITALVKLQEDCGVADLKMSDFGFTPHEAMTLAKGARSMQGGLFEANPCEMTDEDCAGIFEKSYR